MASNRRLAAIMFTDMVGSTASAQSNEANALKLRDEQERLLRPIFAAHAGREIKSMGDGFLVEFDSALRATQCAVHIQQQLHERNARPGGTAIQVRIGVHLGDVEQRESDIFGDAVNIAARIEPTAEPGGICLSGAVFEQIRNKISERLDKLPPTSLKGVDVPVDLYRVVLPWNARSSPADALAPHGIAVLPFANISPDPKDEYFAEGLTEELITLLSQVREFRVISRTSVMQYRATTKSAFQIGTELGVTSLLEGSVRKAGNRLRVTAQLIDAQSDRHLWAKTYDRELDDIFAVQTEVSKQVAEAMQVNLRAAESTRLESRPTIRQDSYLAYLKGRTLRADVRRPSLEAAKEQFELAISLDPNNAAAHAGLADVTRMMCWWFPDVPKETWDRLARRSAARAIELDPDLAEAHASLGIVHWEDLDYPGAERELRQAIALSPSYSQAHELLAHVLQDLGQGNEALREFALAEAADPLWGFNLYHYAHALIWAGRYEEALIRIRKGAELFPEGSGPHELLADLHLRRGEREPAIEEFRRAAEADTASGEDRLSNRAWYYAVSGRTDEFEALARDPAMLNIPLGPWHLALVQAYLGNLDACFQLLDRKLARDGGMPLQNLRLDPLLENVRNDPRFLTLLKKMNVE